MADQEALKFTLVHGSKKFSVELPVNGCDKGPTVDDLANLAVQLAEVPRESQRLIFKGHSLTDFTQPLVSLGIKKGSKVMLIGKKFDPLEEENMKVILATEKKTDDVEKRLNENLEELSGIEKGFLQPDLVPKALEKLTRKLQGINEEFMKTLESLDALLTVTWYRICHAGERVAYWDNQNKIIDPSLQQAKGKRKSLIKRIQVLLDKTDETSSKIESLKEK